ncbi:HAD family hydrolase [Paenibacillus sp. EC2-1]|uniref:HAD family hydrolase n=1 Tax=Paenibacillus sp. EC2-1 TaxID=3388665 RepID=UPI003BEF07EC
MTIKAVFFDLFETLVTEFSENIRISKRNYDYMNILGLSNEDFKKEWRIRRERRMAGVFSDYPSVLRDILSSRGLKDDIEAIDFLHQERIKEKCIPFRNIHSEITDLLTYIKSKGIKIGLISNCTEEEVRYWNGSALTPYFDDAIFSFEVGLAKPDQRIYELACERLLVKPSESIFVGDGGSSELEGAARAGLIPYHATWFNTHIKSGFRKCSSPIEVMGNL